MSKKVPFTEEQLRVLELNPYTYSVSSNRITFTLEFKKFFVDQIRNHRKTTPEVLKAAGYDPSWFAQGCKSSLRRRILEEADSEQGLRPPRGLSTEQQLAAFEAKRSFYPKKQMPVSKELQERIVHLEKQVEFLKKISNIVTNPKLQ